MTALNVGLGDARRVRRPRQFGLTIWAVAGMLIALATIAFDWTAPSSTLLRHLQQEAVGMAIIGVVAIVLIYAAMFAIGHIVLAAAFGSGNRKASSARDAARRKTD